MSFDIIHFLKSAVAAGASDEHLKVGYPPFVRKNGVIKKTNMAPITLKELEDAIINITPSTIADTIVSELDIDFMFEIKDCSRFRVNYNRQMGSPALVIRNIPHKIPLPDELNIPSILQDIIKYPNGIILVTGATGSGKSTTLASLIQELSKNFSKHIITIEDPIEYMFDCQKSIVSQRQVEVDTKNFVSGIKYSLRQDPDIIFIGEIRDKETMEAALKAAETGHLVFSTLHTNDAIQTINRIMNMFEESNRFFVRRQLSECLRATIAQKLVYSKENNKRYPAFEIMVVTPTIKDYICKDNLDAIYELLRETNIDEMISMNLSLFNLVEKGCISQEEALENSNDSNELIKMFKGIYQGTKEYYE